VRKERRREVRKKKIGGESDGREGRGGRGGGGGKVGGEVQRDPQKYTK
jgi:hypothetical protein